MQSEDFNIVQHRWLDWGRQNWPVLFLIFINDLECRILSNTLKFADDTKLFAVVNDDSDRRKLQNDLDLLCYWADKWQMKFNVDECSVIHVANSSINSDYVENGKQIEEVNSEKDFGILVTSDLNVALQMAVACNKSNYYAWTG